MLAVDVILQAFLGYYFDQVIPTKDGFGVKRPWNFICRKYIKSSKDTCAESSLKLGEEIQDPEKVKKGNFESIQSQVKRDSFSLKVRNLRKVFSNSKVAVDDCSMTLYSG